MTPFSTSVFFPYQMLHGQGSPEAPTGASKLPRPKEIHLFCVGLGSSLFKKEFAGIAAADSATSASVFWNPCTREGWQELKGEQAPGAAWKVFEWQDPQTGPSNEAEHRECHQIGNGSRDSSFSQLEKYAERRKTGFAAWWIEVGLSYFIISLVPFPLSWRAHSCSEQKQKFLFSDQYSHSPFIVLLPADTGKQHLCCSSLNTNYGEC